MRESDVRALLRSALGSKVRRAVLPVGFSVAFAACAYGAPFDELDAGRVRDGAADSDVPDVAPSDGNAGDATDGTESDGDSDARD